MAQAEIKPKEEALEERSIFRRFIDDLAKPMQKYLFEEEKPEQKTTEEVQIAQT